MNDMSTTPKVSVIMPCYNEPEEIFRRSLESVVNQTLEEIEIIIILDNPDNHELEEIIGEYQRIHSNILLLTPEQNLGRGEARNLGISFAQGEYIAIHDADDIDIPTRLETQLEHMEANPQLSAMISQVRNVDSIGISSPHQPKDLSSKEDSFFRKPFNHPTFFIKTEVIKRFGGYKNLNFGEDFDLWLRLYLSGEPIDIQDKVLVDYLSPEFSTHSEYLTKMKDWKRAGISRSLRYFFHPKALFDSHFHRRYIRTMIDYLVLLIAPGSYDTYTENMFQTMNKVRSLAGRSSIK